MTLAPAGCGGSSAAGEKQTAVPPTTKPRVIKVPANPGKKGGKAVPILDATPLPTPTRFPAASYNATLTGRVTDAKSKSPLAGAIVSIGNGQRAVRTDGSGMYRTKIPSGAPVAVQVGINGYVEGLSMGQVKRGSTTTLNFALTRIEPGQPPAPSPPGVFGGS